MLSHRILVIAWFAMIKFVCQVSSGKPEHPKNKLLPQIASAYLTMTRFATVLRLAMTRVGMINRNEAVTKISENIFPLYV